MALGLAFSTAAVGCGDDDDTDQGGTGGGGSSGNAGKAGGGGKSGSGGAGKAGSSGGGATTPAACVTQTTAIMKDQADPLSAGCISCLCDAAAAAIIACDTDANCWPLLGCVAEKCTDPANQATCAGSMCGQFIAGGGKAQAVGAPLQGTCASKCINEGDGGVDAGF